MGAGHTHSHRGHAGHPHHDGHRSGNQKRLLLVLALVLVFMVIEFVGGLVSGSLALMADAGHMLSDAAALALSLFAIGMAKRPATATRTYGFYRTEILAALFNGATLIAIAIFIVVEAYERLRTPEDIQSPVMIAIAAAGLAVNLAGLAILHGGRGDSLNIKGAYLHVLGDALGSIGAIAAGAAIWLFGWYWADPVVSALIALLILASSWALVRQSVGVLMEGTPGGINVDEVRAALLAVPDVEGVHDLHVWSITSGLDSLSVHVVCTRNDMGIAELGALLNKLRSMLHEQFGLDHVTIQLEPAGFTESALPAGCTDCYAASTNREA